MKNREKLSRIYLLPFFGLLFLLLIYFLGDNFFVNKTSAESVTTTITVGNSAPEFTIGPIENPTSSTTTPTNVGSDILFQATAQDLNGDGYYMIICSSDSVTATDGGAPTCGDTTWCVSTLTGSASQASCSYTTQESDVRTNDWYAFACDSISSGAVCSDSHQGSGESGSPFVVNHRPNFTGVSNNSPVDPGATVTWTTTALDSHGDNVKLLVCKTASITGDSCTGDSWCESSFVSSNPSCSHNVPVVSP